MRRRAGVTAKGKSEDAEHARVESMLLQYVREFELVFARQEEESVECRRQYDDHQWPRADKGRLGRQRRPALTLNLLKAIVNVVLGYEIQNRQKAVFIPAEPNPETGMAAIQAEEAERMAPQMPPGMPPGMPQDGPGALGGPGAMAGMPPGLMEALSASGGTAGPSGNGNGGLPEPPSGGPPAVGPGGPLPPGGMGMGLMPGGPAPAPQGAAPITTSIENPMAELASLATSANEWALGLRGSNARSRAFMDLLIEGLGGTQGKLDYERDPDGMWVQNWIPRRELLYDIRARELNMEDRRWCGRRRKMRISDIIEILPEYEKEIRFAAATQPDISGQIGPTAIGASFPLGLLIENPTPYKPSEQVTYPAGTEPLAKLAAEAWYYEIEWWEREPYYRVLVSEVDELTGEEAQDEQGDPIFETTFMSPDAFRLHEKAEKEAGRQVRAIEQVRRKYRRGIFVGNKLIRTRDLITQDPRAGFTIKMLACLFDEEKGVWYGFVRSMIEPQQGLNKTLSQALHIFNSSPKGIFLHETGAIARPRELENRLARAGTNLEMTEGSVTNKRYDYLPPATFPAHSFDLVQIYVTAFHLISGVNVEVTGASEGNEPGVTVAARQEQGLTILAWFFNALSTYRYEEAMLVHCYLRDHLSNGQWIRIGGPYDSRAVKLLKEPMSLKYDLMIDETPAGPNAKREFWRQVGELGIAPIMFRNGQFPPVLWDWMEIPASMAAELKAHQKMISAQPPPTAKPPELIQAEVQQKLADAALRRARAEDIPQRVVMDREEMEGDRQESELEMRLKIMELKHETQSKQLDLLMKQLDVRGKAADHGQRRTEGRMKLAELEDKRREREAQAARQANPNAAADRALDTGE